MWLEGGYEKIIINDIFYDSSHGLINSSKNSSWTPNNLNDTFIFSAWVIILVGVYTVNPTFLILVTGYEDLIQHWQCYTGMIVTLQIFKSQSQSRSLCFRKNRLVLISFSLNWFWWENYFYSNLLSQCAQGVLIWGREIYHGEEEMNHSCVISWKVLSNHFFLIERLILFFFNVKTW